nr:hypothetical protein [Mycoplasmopsis bovis]
MSSIISISSMPLIVCIIVKTRIQQMKA